MGRDKGTFSQSAKSKKPTTNSRKAEQHPTTGERLNPRDEGAWWTTE